MNETTTLPQLVNDLTPLGSVDEVRRQNNSFCLNEHGDVVALSLSGSNLTALALGQEAQALQHLYLSDNPSLQSLDIQVPLPHLVHLYLDTCALVQFHLPAGCHALQHLYLQNNQLTRVVFQDDCPQLQLIDLGGNQLTEFSLPAGFHHMRYLYLQDNPLSNPPQEILADKKNCWPAVRNYLIALRSGRILNNEAKCIFFGNGRVGKTTLSHQLRTGQFDPTIQYTHGILIEEWNIPQKDFPEPLNKKIEEQIELLKQENKQETLPAPNKLTLKVWDFGGQEYFHATHRLFLNSNVFYLLVWELATNRQDEEAGHYPLPYWVNNIQHYAPNNLTLTIQNKEAGKAVIDNEALQYKVADQRGQPNQYETDIKKLKQGILSRLHQLEPLCKPIPKIWDDIRTEIRNRSRQDPFLRYTDFKNLCHRLDQTPGRIMQSEDQIESLVTFLHETGSLICYRFIKKENKKSAELDNYVFINPQWVTNTIYHILNEECKKQDGQFDKAHVAGVLKNKNNVIQEVDLWIGLMQQFELIFEKKGLPGQFIAPQYLPLECRDLTEKTRKNLDKDLPCHLVLTYPDFLPKSVMSRFIARHGNLAEDIYWKNGIEIRQEQDVDSIAERAFVHCRYLPDRGEIVIQTRDPLSGFALQLFETLRDIDDTQRLEVSVPHWQEKAKMVGPVNYLKLKERFEKGRDDVEWAGKEFETVHFKALFEKSMMAKRGLAIGSRAPIEVPANQILEVKKAAGAKDYIPFNNIEGKIKILFLTATPMRASQLNTGKESRFKDLIRYFDQEKRYRLIEEHGIKSEDFHNFAVSEKPHILHYGGHGEVEGIVLEDTELEAEVLVDILKLNPNLQCVILNACYSLPIAQKLAQYIPYVVGTQDAIHDVTAISFARGFYTGIVSGYKVEDAFQNGLLNVKREKHPHPGVLVLVKGIPTAQSNQTP